MPVRSEGDGRVGQVLIGRYQLRRVIADGSMGRVYEGLDLASRRSVAVKILHPDVAADPVQIARFRREFQVSQLLPESFVAEVLDFVDIGTGERALVMELLQGEVLRATLEREGTLRPGRLVRLMSQVALGLDQAHALGLVHRDLKPENVFLCQTPAGDLVKVLDFGSIKDTTRGAALLTQLGTTLGSPYYMSPEQAQGLPDIDRRADVWSLAAVSYECLTGQVPFSGGTPARILRAILHERPASPSHAARSLGRELPRRIDRVLERALSKPRQARFETAGEFAEALGRAFGLEGDPITWAAQQEHELGIVIESRWPALLAEAAAPPGSDAALDAFFGDSLGLGGAPPPLSVPPRPAQEGPAEHEPTVSPPPLAASPGPAQLVSGEAFSARKTKPLLLGLMAAFALALLTWLWIGL